MPDELFRGDRAGGLLALEHRAAASASRRTRCCRRGSSPTPTPTATGSARTTRRCRSTRPGVPVHHYHKDGPMRFFRNRPATPTPTTSRTRSTVRSSDPAREEPPLQALGRRRPLQSPRRQRRLRPAARAVQPVRRGPEGAAVLQHRRGDGGRAGGDRRAPAADTSKRCTPNTPRASAPRWPRRQERWRRPVRSRSGRFGEGGPRTAPDGPSSREQDERMIAPPHDARDRPGEPHV